MPFSLYSYQLKMSTYSALDWLAFFLPCVRWLRTYKIREYLFVRGNSRVGMGCDCLCWLAKAVASRECAETGSAVAC